MEYQTGDIVRFKFRKRIDGLHEVTGESKNGEISLTADECGSEFCAQKEDLIFVCSVSDRKDLN